jgi:hypothetical protein
MTDTSSREVHYSLAALASDICRMGRHGIQRTFGWANAEVFDLFDSMCLGYRKLAWTVA